jgi:multiple sugar transport system permease protein
MKRRDVALCAFVVLLVAWCLLPIYWMVDFSLMCPSEIYTVPAYFVAPHPFIANFFRVLGFAVPTPCGGEMTSFASGHSAQVKAGLWNSIIVAIPTMLLTMLLATPAGYVFGRMSFPYKGALFFTLLFSRSLPPVSVVIPYFMFYYAAGLLGTQIGLVLIYLTITVPLITWVLMGFLGTLPRDIEAAARVDGMTRLQAFRRVILPVGLPGISTCALLAFLMSWSEFMFAWILVGGTPAGTLPPAITGMMMIHAEIDLMSAANVIALIPAIVAAIVLQRYITQLRIVGAPI